MLFVNAKLVLRTIVTIKQIRRMGSPQTKVKASWISVKTRRMAIRRLFEQLESLMGEIDALNFISAVFEIFKLVLINLVKMTMVDKRAAEK